MLLAHTLDGHGPERVLLLHDWLGDSANYDAAMPYLDLATLTCARVDLPGYGGSRAELPRGVDASCLDAMHETPPLFATMVERFVRQHPLAHARPVPKVRQRR